MVVTRRIRLDRISSATRNLGLDRDVLISPDVLSEDGYVLAVRVLQDKAVYNVVEDTDGRLLPLREGDVLAGVLGTRRALKGYAGTVPEVLSPGEKVQVLNLGGVLGWCTSVNPELGPPFDAEVLGAVLEFPSIGDRVGRAAHIGTRAIPLSDDLAATAPVVYVAGTSMNSGKTVAASEIIRGLSRAGLTVGGLKLTGVSLRRDALSMLDYGAACALTFNDAGIVSTSQADVLSAARGLLNRMLVNDKVDVVVAELGDGILGEYGVDEILGATDLMAMSAALVICAPDQVGAWGAARILAERFGLEPSVLTGPVTDNEVGKGFIEKELGLPAFNAVRDTESLVALVRDEVDDRR